MSDPLSVTASVVGIVGALLHGSKRLFEFIDSLRNAPKDIAALSADLRALYEVLAHITNIQDKLSSNPGLCASLKAPLENYERTRRFEEDFKEEFRDIRSRLRALDGDRVELASVAGCKGSEWYGTEADFAMKRFLEYTESLCDSPPASFPGSPTQPPSEAYLELDTQEGTQDSASLRQRNGTSSAMLFAGKESPGSHIDTAHPQFHTVCLSVPHPETYHTRVTKLSDLVSDHAASSALNNQGLTSKQQAPESSQEPMDTDFDLQPTNPTNLMHTQPHITTSDPAVNQHTEADQPPPHPSPHLPSVWRTIPTEHIDNTAKPQPSTTSPDPPRSGFKYVYNKSGFDVIRALWLMSTRKNPRINIGAIDITCSFVVCDVSMNDCPIIYVSDNFQNLTGYSRYEIIGQNCRFLQAPDGKVEAGSKREFVDDGAVYNLKKMIHEGREVQQSLINYRKGGKPFLNLLTIIPIPWDTDEIRYFIGFQIDLVECPDAIASNQDLSGVKVNYKHSDIGQYIWTPPQSSQWEPENGQTLGVDDVSTLLQQFSPNGLTSNWHKQSWDKMLLENTDDVVHVLSLEGLFLYLSPSCKKVLEYEAADLVGNSLSTVCHPSDINLVTRELKDTTTGNPVNIIFRIRRKHSGYTWFESHGSLSVEEGKGRKCIILVGRKRPVFALSRRNLEANGGIGDSEFWTKLSTSGLFLYVSSNIRSLLDLQPDSLVGTSIQDLMQKESRPEFGRAAEKARRGKIVTCKHEVQNRRGQVLQAQTTLYPGDASESQKPSFLLAQIKLLKASSRSLTPASISGSKSIAATPGSNNGSENHATGHILQHAGSAMVPGTQDAALASEDNIFDELRTTNCSSWQFELRQMEKVNCILAEELGGLLSSKKKHKRRKGAGNVVRDCANCHTRNTPEWRRGPSGQRDLCNSCGLRWAKQVGRTNP
ncbi:blue light receptor [Fusarium sp. DS 682]|nr:blue light receptor [Fusarium sp. DS 682]